MSTQFTSTVKPSGGDYTHLNTAVTGLANDITTADIKVFSISASTEPTIAAGNTVLGQTSLATGVCVLVNAARTQILIKTIGVASFLSGEIVQETGVPTVTVTLSNAGDSPIIGIECYSMSDTVPVDISGYTTNVTNYIYIYTPLSERHDGKWNATKYRLEISIGDDNAIAIATANVKIIGLQIDIALYKRAIYNYGSPVEVGYTIIHSSLITGGWRGMDGVTTAYNNIIYGFNVDSDSYGLNVGYAYNNTVYGCYYGYFTWGGCIAKNNISYNNIYNYYGSYDISSDYNLSGPIQTNAPGTHSQQAKTLTFTNTTIGTEDFHLNISDTSAINNGIDNPGSGLYYDDINGKIRTTPWDIGADEYTGCSTIQIRFEVS